ncbi:MAG: MOP flippase family protein [Desulfobacterales bacterium]|jgi:PST family polysaccharide transporter
MSLKKQTIAGIEWSVAARTLKTLLQFLIFVILIRLLSPKDFGLMAMIMVFSGFVSIFSEIGFGAAIIQRLDINENHLSSVFWINVSLGILLALVMALLAPLISKFYEEALLEPITVLISTTFVISSLSSIHKAILKRSMDFRKLAIVETTGILIGGSLAIVLAILNFGVWSLVWQSIITTTASVLIFWKVSYWRPQIKFDTNAVKDLLNFSKNLFGFNFFNYWSRNIDDLLIGKFIGTTELGIYTRAYGIMVMPINQIASTIGQVMFPSLSKIQSDKLRVKEIYLKTVGIIALVTFPLMTTLLIVSESFIIAVFGNKWTEMIPILRVFCIIGLMQSIVSTVGWIYNSQGRTDLMFRWGIVAGTIGVISFIIGVWIGSVQAVVICYAMANIMLLYHNFTIPGRLINMTFYDVLSRIIGILGCAIVMAVCVSFLAFFIPQEWSHWSKLIIKVPFGIIIYGVAIHAINLKSYVQIKDLIREQWAYHFAG